MPDRGSRERNPTELVYKSPEPTYESTSQAHEEVLHVIPSYDVESSSDFHYREICLIPTTYFPTDDDRSKDSQSSFLIHRKNTQKQRPRHTERPFTYHDRSARFQRPGWEANNARR